MVNKTGNNNYKVVNSPSDGHPRNVANCVILSRAPARNNFRGWSQENNYWRYYGSNGLSYTNWLWDNELQSWYYLKQDGTMACNEWIWDNSYQGYYYLGSNGKMYVNFYTPDGYLVDNSGKCVLN